jgi:hypothetical protein
MERSDIDSSEALSLKETAGGRDQTPKWRMLDGVDFPLLREDIEPPTGVAHFGGTR